MKYLKTFENFNLILEAELKHSETLEKKLIELYTKFVNELDNPKERTGPIFKKKPLGSTPVTFKKKPPFDDKVSGGSIIDKLNKKPENVSEAIFKKKNPEEIEEIEKLHKYNDLENERESYVRGLGETLKVEASDVIYPKIKLQLGAIILQKCAELNFRLDKPFIDEVKECITQKKLTSNFTEYLKKCIVQLDFKPFYLKPEKVVKMGSLVMSLDPKEVFEKKDVMFKCSIKLNLFNHEQIRNEFKETIRHELQHLTQRTNTICLNISEFCIKNINNLQNLNLFDEISKILKNSIKNSKVGVSKTLTGLKQSGHGEMFDAKTGKETSLKSAFQKVYKKDSKDGLTPDETELAKELEYLGDDSEYKPWMSDKAAKWYKFMLEYEKEEGKKMADGDIDTQLRIIVPHALESDEELALLNKLRKETSGEFYRYMRKKIEKESA